MKRIWGLLLIFLMPGNAWAHSSIPGMKGIYGAMLHPFTVGPQLLALIALSLFIQQRLPESEDAFHGLWIGSVLGAVLAALGVSGLNTDIALIILTMVIAIAVAAALRLPVLVTALVGGISGLLSGYVSWPEPGAASDMMFTALGAIAGSVLIVIILAGSLELIRVKTGWPWVLVAVRVAGSWVAAISMLLGALVVKKMV